jgi:hypothetical protein
MTAFAYVRGDPINRRDPSGTQDICAGPRCDADGTAVVTGPGRGWTLADIDAGGLLRANQDLNTGCSFIYYPTVRDRDCDRLINWATVRFLDAPAPAPVPPLTPSRDDPRCTRAAREPGRIIFEGRSFDWIIGLGFTGGSGRFWNLQTNTRGYYDSIGLGAGLLVGGGQDFGSSTSAGDFRGFGDNTAVARNGFVAFTATYDVERRRVGSTGTFGVGAPGFAGSYTDTRLYNCTLGEG